MRAKGIAEPKSKSQRKSKGNKYLVYRIACVSPLKSAFLFHDLTLSKHHRYICEWATALCLTAQKLSLAPLHRVCHHILLCAQVLAAKPKLRRLQRCSRAREGIVGSGDSSICVHIGLARHAIILKIGIFLLVGRAPMDIIAVHYMDPHRLLLQVSEPMLGRCWF